MPRLPRAVAVSLALHFLVVLSLAMIRVGKAPDPFPPALMVDLASFAPSPHEAPPLPPSLPPLMSSETPELAAGTPDGAPRSPAAPPSTGEVPSPPPAAGEAPPSPPAVAAAKTEAPPVEPSPAPPTRESMAPVATAPPPSPAPEAPPATPSSVPSHAASRPPAPPAPAGVPGGDPAATLMAACRFAQEAAPIAEDLIRRMFPPAVLGVVLWGEGQVRIEWHPDGTVNHWVSQATDRRLASALEQVHWCEFPHPSTFGLPNRAVVVDFQVTRGRLVYRLTPA